MDYIFKYADKYVYIDKDGSLEIEGNTIEMPRGIYEIKSLVGTNLVDFLNFDVENELTNKYDFTNFDIGYIKVDENIPVFVRQFLDILYDTKTNQFKDNEINNFKQLKKFYEKLLKVCFDIEQTDINKTRAIDRYRKYLSLNKINYSINENISNDWICFSSLEQALHVEFTQSILTDRNIFKCASCGCYTVAQTKKRGKLCTRMNYVTIRDDLDPPYCFIVKSCQISQKDKRAREKANKHIISEICYKQTLAFYKYYSNQKSNLIKRKNKLEDKRKKYNESINILSQKLAEFDKKNNAYYNVLEKCENIKTDFESRGIESELEQIEKTLQFYPTNYENKLIILGNIRRKSTFYINKYDSSDSDNQHSLTDEYVKLFKGLYMDSYPKGLLKILNS